MKSKFRNIQILRTVINFSFGILGIFFNIFIFSILKSVGLTLAGNVLIYFGVLLGFAVLGYFFGQFKVPLRLSFPAGLILIALSYAVLLLGNSVEVIFSFLFIYGVGNGIMWHGIMCLEQDKIGYDDRDKYVSQLGVLSKIIDIGTPILVTFLFFIFYKNAYILMFLVSFFGFFISGLLSFKISEFVPKPINWNEIKHFFFGKSHYKVHIYTIVDGMSQTLTVVLIPLTAILILQKEVNVGFYSSVISVVSLTLLYLGTKFRNKNNRTSIHLWATVLYLPFVFLFCLDTNLATFLILSLADLVFLPQIDVSRHSLDLYTMEVTSVPGGGFYASTLLREINIFFGRFVSGVIFYFLIYKNYSPLLSIKIGYVLLLLCLVLRVFVGDRLLKMVK